MPYTTCACHITHVVLSTCILCLHMYHCLLGLCAYMDLLHTNDDSFILEVTHRSSVTHAVVA